MSRASPTAGDNSGNGQLRAFVERILRLKEEQDNIAADAKEVYKEAKGAGFNTTTISQVVGYVRKREKNAEKVSELETLFGLYLAAYEGKIQSGTDHAPRAARDLPAYDAEPNKTYRATVYDDGTSDVEIVEHDPETGEILEQPETATEVRSASTDAPETPGKQCTSVVSRDEAGQNLTGNPIHESPEPEPLPEQAKPEADSNAASGDPFEPLAFLKKAEINERCEKQGDCKFARHPHKVTCSDCGTAWAISQRKRERAE